MRATLRLPIVLAILSCAGCTPFDADRRVGESVFLDNTLRLADVADAAARGLGWQRQAVVKGVHGLGAVDDRTGAELPRIDVVRVYAADYGGTTVTFEVGYNFTRRFVEVRATPQPEKSVAAARLNSDLARFTFDVQQGSLEEPIGFPRDDASSTEASSALRHALHH